MTFINKSETPSFRTASHYYTTLVINDLMYHTGPTQLGFESFRPMMLPDLNANPIDPSLRHSDPEVGSVARSDVLRIFEYLIVRRVVPRGGDGESLRSNLTKSISLEFRFRPLHRHIHIRHQDSMQSMHSADEALARGMGPLVPVHEPYLLCLPMFWHLA